MNDDVRRYLIEILIRARAEVNQAAEKAVRAINDVAGADKKAAEASKAGAQADRQRVSELDRIHEARIREKRDLESAASSRRAEASATRDQISGLREQLKAVRENQAENIKQARTLQDLADARERTTGKIDNETKALNRQSLGYARAADQNRKLGDQINRNIASLEKQSKAMDTDARTAERLAQSVDKQIGSIDRQIATLRKQEAALDGVEKMQRQADAAAKKAREEADRAAASERKQILAEQAHQEQIAKTTRNYRSFVETLDDTSEKLDENRATFKRFSQDFDKLSRNYDTGDASARHFGAAAEDARNRMAGLGREVEKQTSGSSGGGGLSRLRSLLNGTGGDADRASYNVAKLGLALQGIQVAFAIKYAQALLTVMVGLAGALAAVAGAAVQAGVALGASLAAGAAQAIPVVGLLAGALYAVSQVIKAVNLANQQKLLRDREATKQASTVQSANERIADSERALAEAHRAVGVERDKAIRQIEDLINAEDRAKQAADDSALSLEDTQTRLQQLLATGGSAADIAQAQSAVANARLDRSDASTTVRRSIVDAVQARRGPDQQENVIAARRREADAARNLARARNDAAAAALNESAATDRLQATLAAFSPAQRRVYKTLTEFLKNLRAVFIGTKDKDGILGPLIDAIVGALQRADELIKNSTIVRSLSDLSRTLANQIKRFTNLGSNEQSQGFFLTITREARRNLPLVGDIFERVFTVVRRVVVAALPAFRDLLKLVNGYATEAEGATRHTSGLTEFFRKGVAYLDSFVRLGLAAVDVLVALLKAGGAEEGAKGIDGLTKALQKAADWIDENRSRVKKFFHDSITIAKQVGVVLLAVGAQVARLFDPSNSKAFVDFLTRVLIPAIGTVIEVMGSLTQVAHEFLSLPFVNDMASWLVSVILLVKGMSILKESLKGIATVLGVVRHEGKLTFVGNPWLLAIGAIVTALVLLDQKFGIFKKFGDLFKSASDKAREAADKFTAAIDRQVDALRRQRDAEASRQNARLALSRAEIAVERARQQVGSVEKQIQSGQLKGQEATIARREASIGLKQALLDEKQAHVDLKTAHDAEKKSDADAVTESKKTIESAKDRIGTLKNVRTEIDKNIDRDKKIIDTDSKLLKTLTPGTDKYRFVTQQLAEAKKDLASQEDKLKDNTSDMRKEADRSNDAFKRWRNAVKRAGSSTENFGDVVNSTMQGIAEDVNDVLTEFGAKPIKFSVKKRKRTSVERGDATQQLLGSDPIGGFQSGGMVMNVPGSGSGDKVRLQADVEPHEKVFVLNRNASAYLDHLQRLNSAVPRFAKGGQIVPIPGMPGESIDKRILGDVMRLIRQYKLLVTDGYAPSGHAAHGEHPLGLAIDAVPGPGGSWDLIDRLAKFAEPTQNHPRAPWRWVGYDGDAGHGRGNHIHLSWLHDGLKSVQTMGGSSALMAEVTRRIVSGPDGALKSILQGAEKRARGAGNRFINRQLAKMGPSSLGLEDAVGGGARAAAPAQVRRWAAQALRYTDHYSASNLNRLVGRIMQESGGDPDIVQKVKDVNSASGDPAVGLAQVIGATFAAYRDKRLPNDRRNPLSNLVAAINYMFGRYGHIVGPSSSGYQRGGLIPFAGAFGDGGSFIARQPTAYVAGDKGVERVDVTPLQRGGAPRSSPATSAALGEIVDVLSGASGSASKFRVALAVVFGQDGLFAKMTQAISDISVAAQATLQRARFLVTRGGAFRRSLDTSGVSAATGVSAGGPSFLQDAAAAQLGVGTLRRQRTGLTQQGFVLDQAIQQARARLASANAANDKKAAQQAQGQINDLKKQVTANRQALAQNAEDVVTAQESFQQAVFDAVNNFAQFQQNALSRLQRRMVALGRPLDPTALAQKSVEIMGQQIQGLIQVVNQAGVSGNTTLRQSAMEQIEELYVSIDEARASAFQGQIDAVNQTASRSLSNNDRRQAFAQIGSTDYGALGSALSARGGILQTQRSGLQNLLAQAQATGNLTQIDNLSDAIADLDLSIAQNTQAVQDNTDAAFQATTAAINDKASFQTGIGGSAITFFQKLASITGIDTTTQQKGVLATNISTLGTQRQGLGKQLSSLLGPGYENVQNLQGADLVNFLLSISSGPLFDSIMSRLDPSQQSSFKDLVSGLLDNAEATQENTEQLRELNGSDAQGFTTSAFQLYRRAIFNGAGNLLPRFQLTLPHAAAGAQILSDGMIVGHKGETITPAKVAAYDHGGAGDTNIDVNLTTPVQVFDPEDAGRQIAFEFNKRKGSR
jgi:chromosome segregation ATPase